MAGGVYGAERRIPVHDRVDFRLSAVVSDAGSRMTLHHRPAFFPYVGTRVVVSLDFVAAELSAPRTRGKD
jgi:hypothetical protein